jgi:hypothetical protein
MIVLSGLSIDIDRYMEGFFESCHLPLPSQEKEGKCGDTPHPAKGRLPLGTLLRSTFEKPWIHGSQLGAIKNIQVLIVLDVIVNLL